MLHGPGGSDRSSASVSGDTLPSMLTCGAAAERERSAGQGRRVQAGCVPRDVTRHVGGARSPHPAMRDCVIKGFHTGRAASEILMQVSKF